MAKYSERWLAAARKSAAWLAAHQTPQGNYIGREKPDAKGLYPDTDDVGCYYKSVYPLRVAGESVAAARMLQHLVDRFMQPNGDLVNSPTQRTSGSYTPNYCQLYPNMWITRGANALRWYDVQKKLSNFIFQYRDPETGGFLATVTPATRTVDSNATGVGIMISIHNGRLDFAKQSCDFLLKMLKEQTDPNRLYFRYNLDKGLETDMTGKDEKTQWNYYIDRIKDKQAYWPMAMPMVNLTNVWVLTGEKKYLDGAMQIFEFLEKCHDHAFAWLTSGKCGWGAAILYRLLGEKRFRDKAVSQMEFIIKSQHAEGFMMGPGVSSELEQTARINYDYTSEWTSWLTDSATEFAAKGE